MLSSASYRLRHCQRRPLAASAIALFAVSTTSAWATPPAVTNCNDDGSVGSLRYAVDPAHGAVSGDTIDMSGLTTGDPGCSTSTITLTTGAIQVTQKNLALKGPGRKALTIAAAPNSRVIVHDYAANTGHLYVEDLRMGFGSISSSSGGVYGGCVASLNGALTLSDVGLYYCSVTTTGTGADSTAKAFGGGVFAATSLIITAGSVLLHNTASATMAGARVQGGCAMTFGSFYLNDSVVAYCDATDPAGSKRVFGGALELRGNTTITRSLIARSYSSAYIGGVDASTGGGAGTLTATISNSTITENSAHSLIGGLYSNLGHVNINNSTIVLNTAGAYTYTIGSSTYFNAPGVSVVGSVAAVALSLQSTIIANNSAGGTQEDLATGAPKNVTITGSNNLVKAYKSDVTLPSGQGNLTGVCPLLGPIRDNGGPTYTHALQSGSPAIDAGNNAANEPYTGVPAVYDERGQGPAPPFYERVSGPSADIGAYEVQKSDIVFDAGLDGCP